MSVMILTNNIYTHLCGDHKTLKPISYFANVDWFDMSAPLLIHAESKLVPWGLSSSIFTSYFIFSYIEI